MFSIELRVRVLLYKLVSKYLALIFGSFFFIYSPQCSGSVVAVDASVWMYQITRGVRTPTPHIVGFLRRVCALLMQDVKPVFVFDGPPPLLKMQTLVRATRRKKKK